MKKNQTLLAILLAFLMSGLAVYAYLGNFTRMIADDFCIGYRVNRLGLLRSIWNWYISWNARYTAYAADWIVLKTLGPYNLHYVLPGMLLLWSVVLTAALYLYFKAKGENVFLRAAALSFSLLFTLFLLTPNIEQSLFWWNGARSYSLPLLVLNLYALLYYVAKRFPNIPPGGIYVSSFGLFFLSSGFSETFVVAQAGALVFLILLVFINGKDQKDLRMLAAGLAGTIVALVVIVLAPGNAARQSGPPPALNDLLLISIQGYIQFILDLFNAPEKILGFIGALLLFLWAGMQHKDGSPANKWLIPLNILGGIGLSFICFPPGVFGYSEPPPSRVFIIPVFFLLNCSLYASYLTGQRAAELFNASRIRENFVLILCLAATGCSVIVKSTELLGQRQEYIAFAQKWDEVDRMILTAKARDEGKVHIPAMVNWAYLEAPTNNPMYWVTYCYSAYYEIHVAGPPYEDLLKLYDEQRLNSK